MSIRLLASLFPVVRRLPRFALRRCLRALLCEHPAPAVAAFVWRKKIVMMGLSEEDGRSDEEGRSSSSCSYADLIKNGAIAVSLSLVLCLGGGP
ncbi:unnamed protein product [Sphagnum jensenii]|uniref:Uncharacterized protein n=1 Tax=Sphagnum jensenii TaxID=128206 RepID=A0ABP0VPR9_9BRYO